MNTYLSATQEEAVDAYCDHMIIIRNQLARLTEWADDHGGLTPDEITWSHVGHVAQICTDLQDMIDFVFQEGEYAEALEATR